MMEMLQFLVLCALMNAANSMPLSDLVEEVRIATPGLKQHLALKQQLPLWHTSLVHAPTYSEDWVLSALPDDIMDNRLTVLLAFRQQNIEKLNSIVSDVSDPHSPIYGNFLSNEEVRSMTAPLRTEIESVTNWAQQASAGGCSMLGSGAVLQCSMSVARASTMFSTVFQQAVHSKTRQHQVVAGDYTLPFHVASMLHAVFGLHELPLPYAQPVFTRMPARKKIPAVTPAVLRSVYAHLPVLGFAWVGSPVCVCGGKSVCMQVRNLWCECVRLGQECSGCC